MSAEIVQEANEIHEEAC